MEAKIRYFISVTGILLGLYLGLVMGLVLLSLKNIRESNWEQTEIYMKRLKNITKFSPFRKIYKISDSAIFLIDIHRGTEEQGNISSLTDKALDLIELIERNQNLITSKEINFWARLLDKKESYEKLKKGFQVIGEDSQKIKSLLEVSQKLLNLKYTFLLQNNMELRATGGFMGSYTQFDFKNGELVNYKIQDIYVPDGQLIGHVNPPAPITESFKTGFWKLRDANWNPDFPKAVKDIAWFFKKGNEPIGDSLVAINLSVVEDLIEIIGPIYVPDYNQEINASNLYSIAQSEAETNFFPGSTQKKDFLGALTRQLIIKMEKLDKIKYLEILECILENLDKKNIQIYFEDLQLQEIIEINNWSGKIFFDKEEGINNDYQFVVESNLGANKANCCVIRQNYQKVEDKGDHYKIYLEINLENQSVNANPNPPKDWGGDYRNYLRIYLPERARVEEIRLNDVGLDSDVDKKYLKEKGLNEYGFFANVPHKERAKIVVFYLLPKEKLKGKYKLQIQKQSGVDFYQEIEFIRGEDVEKSVRLVDRDLKINF